MDVIHLVRNGVPGAALERLAEGLEILKSKICSILHMTKKTAQRVATKKLDIDKSDHIVQLVKVASREKGFFQDHYKAMNWLKQPRYALGNQVPIDLLDATTGVELVMNTLPDVIVPPRSRCLCSRSLRVALEDMAEGGTPWKVPL